MLHFAIHLKITMPYCNTIIFDILINRVARFIHTISMLLIRFRIMTYIHVMITARLTFISGTCLNRFMIIVIAGMRCWYEAHDRPNTRILMIYYWRINTRKQSHFRRGKASFIWLHYAAPNLHKLNIDYNAYANRSKKSLILYQYYF